jgi:hypothetical protein
MGRKVVAVLLPDSGNTFHIPRSEAFSLVSNREAEWLDPKYKSIRKFRQRAAVRGFSARYGEYLAKIQRSDMGRLIVSEIRRSAMVES